MKMRRTTFGLVAVCVLLFAAVLAGCGGTPDDGSSAPEAGNAGTLEQYKEDMQAWVDEYDAQLTQKVAVLETITDPLNASDDQVKGATEFADLMTEAASGLSDIEPPADLASAHKAYADGVTTMAAGFRQYAEAIEKGDVSALEEAMTSMSVGDQIEDAETTLEQALGFKLTSD